MVQIVSRAGWGARRPSGGRNSLSPSPLGVTFHWEGPHMGAFPHSACAGKVRGIQAFHMGPSRGWSDIAYNYVVCPHGVVFEGRGLGVGSGANGSSRANFGWYAVCFLSGERDPFTPAMQTAGAELRAYLRSKGAGARVNGHRDHKSTACPGNEIYAWVQAGAKAAGGVLPLPSVTRTHVVKRGQTLAAIALAFGVGLASLIGANPQIENPNLIRPGQTINVPAPGSQAPSQPVNPPGGPATPAKPSTGSQGGSSASGGGLLKRGSRGSAVVAVQRAVGASPDGIYGSNTEGRVERFQRLHGIGSDGVVGPVTRAHLAEPRGLLKRGSRGHAVQVVQRAVGVTPDGIYGPRTERAVRAFQSRHGIGRDGIVGPVTWSRIF